MKNLKIVKVDITKEKCTPFFHLGVPRLVRLPLRGEANRKLLGSKN